MGYAPKTYNLASSFPTALSAFSPSDSRNTGNHVPSPYIIRTLSRPWPGRNPSSRVSKPRSSRVDLGFHFSARSKRRQRPGIAGHGVLPAVSPSSSPSVLFPSAAVAGACSEPERPPSARSHAASDRPQTALPPARQPPPGRQYRRCSSSAQLRPDPP